MISYELYFKSGDMESITKYKFSNIKDALLKAISLNSSLQLKGYNDRKYIVYKITRELVE